MSGHVPKYKRETSEYYCGAGNCPQVLKYSPSFTNLNT